MMNCQAPSTMLTVLDLNRWNNMKREAQKADLRYEIIKCPICKARTFEYVSYSESLYGTVEQHGNCSRIFKRRLK